MAFPSVTNSFSNGNTADGPAVSQNFTDLVNAFSDGTKDLNMSAGTFAGTVTLNASILFGAASSLGSHILLSANVSWDIGASAKGLRSLYLGGTGAFTVLMKASGSLSASYTLTLPAAVPAIQAPLVMDTSGNVTTAKTVAGLINGGAASGSGTGYTWTRVATGAYDITWTTPFTSASSVFVVASCQESSRVCNPQQVSTATTASIWSFNSSSQAAINTTIYFIAWGV